MKLASINKPLCPLFLGPPLCFRWLFEFLNVIRFSTNAFESLEPLMSLLFPSVCLSVHSGIRLTVKILRFCPNLQTQHGLTVVLYVKVYFTFLMK